jgi:hypothetical protein
MHAHTKTQTETHKQTHTTQSHLAARALPVNFCTADATAVFRRLTKVVRVTRTQLLLDLDAAHVVAVAAALSLARPASQEFAAVFVHARVRSVPSALLTAQRSAPRVAALVVLYME